MNKEKQKEGGVMDNEERDYVKLAALILSIISIIIGLINMFGK